jgi:hypothetical protein
MPNDDDDQADDDDQREAMFATIQGTADGIIEATRRLAARLVVLRADELSDHANAYLVAHARRELTEIIALAAALQAWVAGHQGRKAAMVRRIENG